MVARGKLVPSLLQACPFRLGESDEFDALQMNQASAGLGQTPSLLGFLR